MVKDRITDQTEVLIDLTRKLLAVSLLNAGLPKEEIRVRLHMNANELSNFLKGLEAVKVNKTIKNNK